MAGKDPFKSSQPFFICGCALSDLSHHLTRNHADRQRLPGQATLRAILPPNAFTVISYPVCALIDDVPVAQSVCI